MNPAILESWRIAKIHRHLDERCFAIPKLQRNFVWDGNRAAQLMDSIFRNMPIGSLFLWEMDLKSAQLIRQSTNVLPSFRDSNSVIWFVIDGQQRLSVLYQALKGEKRTNDSGRDINFGHLCFVVNHNKDDAFAPRIVYRKPVPKQFIPISEILTRNWKWRVGKQTVPTLKRIQDCRNRLLKYAVPVIRVQSANLGEIGEVFTRLNSTGMRVSATDRAIAMMGKLDVRAMADELRQKVRDGQFNLKGLGPILLGFSLVAEKLNPDGDPPKLVALAKRWTDMIQEDEEIKEQFTKIWGRYHTALLSAVQYLRDRFLVKDESYLPSDIMLATLSVFFYHHKGQPNTNQAKEIRKWFWTTGIGKRYSGAGYHKNIVGDAKFFQSLAAGSQVHFKFTERLDPAFTIQAEQYKANSARSRAFFCLLASRKPKYLEDGTEIPLGSDVLSPSSSTHRHHIFPQQLLKKHGLPSNSYNSLCNICLIVAQNNQKIGNQLPQDYLADYRIRAKTQFPGVMKSHLIPVDTNSGVWMDDVKSGFKKFRKERLSLIRQAFEERAGIKIFSVL
jgi:hypothetical protein